MTIDTREKELASVSWFQTLRSFQRDTFLGIIIVPVSLGLLALLHQANSKPTVNPEPLFVQLLAVFGVSYGIAWLASRAIAHAHRIVTFAPEVGLVRQFGRAGVSLTDSGDLFFWVKHDAAFMLSAGSVTHWLDTLTGFSVVSAHEWFSNAKQQKESADSQVIIAEFSDRTPIPVAQFGFASRIEITQVFLDLQNSILNRRREFMQQREELKAALQARSV